MSENSLCPNCGIRLPSDAPEGICPACLLQAGFSGDSQWGAEIESKSGSKPTTAPPSNFVPAKPEELAEHFPQLEIIRLLGKGGMGAVYEARQSKLDRKVALKILPPEFGVDPNFAQRFTREARALAKLNHQNIVTVFDFGETNGQYYFIMEFVDGANLRHLMETAGIQANEVLSIVDQICDALQFAHTEGVVHRDIKPENILVDKQGRVKIADFGLAKLVGNILPEESLTGTEQVMGTVRYMAPEQMTGTKHVDHRADIFSLGVIFYELLTGELPVGRFDPPSKMRPLDTRLDDVVLRALEKEPDRRFQHASEVSVEIDSISGNHRDRNETKAKPMTKKMSPGPGQTSPFFHASPYENQSQAESFPNYGLLILGSLMILLGLPMLAISLLTPSYHVFIWIGLGNTLGGGALCSLVFHEGTRWPAGTRTNYGALFGGLFMSLIGLGLLVVSVFTARGGVVLDANNVFVWIGIGLFLGGGGLCCAAWIDEGINRKDDSAKR